MEKKMLTIDLAIDSLFIKIFFTSYIINQDYRYLRLL